MNIINRIIIGATATASVIIGESASLCIRILDNIMVKIFISEKICLTCGKPHKNIAPSNPICPSCHYSKCSCEDEDCDEEEYDPGNLPPLEKDSMMFR
jgi:hypothetical protein